MNDTARPLLKLTRTTADWLLLALLVVVWGSSFAVTKIAVETIPAEWISAGRLAISAALVVPFVLARGGNFSASLLNWRWVIWLTCAGTLLPFYLIAWGTARIDSGLAGVLMALVPLVILVFAHLLLPDEKMTRPKVAGFALGFAGVLVLLGPETILNFGVQGTALFGQLAIIAATLCYGVHASTTRLVPSMSSQELAASTLALGALLAVPLALWLSPHALLEASTRSLLALVVLGTFQTALASLVLYRLLTQAGAGFTAMCNYLIPVFAVVLGAVWLGEQITWKIVIGSAFVLSGIAVSQQIYKRIFKR